MKKFAKLLFLLLTLTLLMLSLLSLFNSIKANGISFSSSQIYTLTGANKENSQITSKFSEEFFVEAQSID